MNAPTGLADRSFFTWGDHNYAIGIVNLLGIPEDEGVLRIGIAHYNTAEEVEHVMAAVKKVRGSQVPIMLFSSN